MLGKGKCLVKYLDLKAYDIASLVFITFLSIIVIVFYGNIPRPHSLLWTYTLLMGLILFSVINIKKTEGLSIIHKTYPLIVIPVIFNTLGDISFYLHGRTYDILLINADLLLFKVHPTVWLCKFIKPWLSTLQYVAYSTYYFIPIVVCLSVFKDTKKYQRAMFYIIFGFYFSYIGYIIFPAMGPRFALNNAHPIPVDITSISKFINSTLNLLENNKYDAFPSGHTQIALICIYLAFRMGKTTLAMCLIPVITGLLISTVYCRYHYVTDVIAGVLWTYISIKICNMYYHKKESHDY